MLFFFHCVHWTFNLCWQLTRFNTKIHDVILGGVALWYPFYSTHSWLEEKQYNIFFWAGCLTFLVSCSFQSVFLMIETKQGFSHDRNKPSESHLKCVLYDVFHFFLAEFFLFLVQKTFLRGVVRPCQVLIQMQLLWFYGRSKDKSEQWLWVVIHSYCSVVTLLVFSL